MDHTTPLPTVSAGRPHAQRLRSDLTDIREELQKTLQVLTPDELDWVPNPDVNMKSFKQILQEIGTMEKVTCHMAQFQKDADWNTTWQSLDKNTIEELLAALTAIRAETLTFLDSCTEAQLQTPIPLNAEWQGYFNVPAVEPEELLRWIARHEYYHLGQITIYQWQRGKSPLIDD